MPTPSISAVTGALNIEEIVLTNLEAVTNSRLRVDPHVARQLEDVKITRYLDEGNVENWADTLSCGFCRVLLEFLENLMNSFCFFIKIFFVIVFVLKRALEPFLGERNSIEKQIKGLKSIQIDLKIRKTYK